MGEEHIGSRLAALLATLKPKTKQPVSTKVLNTWIAQAEGQLGDEAKGGRLGWLIASSVAIAAVQRALDEDGRQLFLLKGGTLLQHRLNVGVRRRCSVKGGVTLFRGTGAAACRYLKSDRSTADDYYLEGGTALAEFAVTNASGEVVAERSLSPEEYAAWVDWIDPVTGTSMGTPRLPGDGRKGSPRFAEMVVNTPKSLSVAAALHPEVSDALDEAEREAANEIRRWLSAHSVTRVGPRGAQEGRPVESSRLAGAAR